MLSITKNALQQATPESQGIASSAILQFVAAVERQIHELHSFILMRHGKVVAEGWWSPYRRENPHMLFSLSKSFTSTAVGLAVSEGHFSLDDKVISFFPDDLPAEINEHLAAMQIRHLLSMSTGHHDDTMPPMGERKDGKWTKGFFAVPVLHKPGTHFLYNTGATYMLSAIIQKTTGMKLVDYLKPRLFDPLGIENPVWEQSPQRINTGGFGLNITTDDIARFGQLYLQKGMWEGQRIIPEAWIDEATSSHISNGDNPESDWNQGYGYQFWRCKHNAYRGDGAFGQYCIVMPEQDAVLAITSGLGDMQEPLNLVWDILLPAMQDKALPEDAAAQDKLTKKLASLNIAPVKGAFSSPTSAQVLDRTYKLETSETLRYDEPNFDSISLNFTESTCIVTLKTGEVEEHITCGYGTWQKGQTRLNSRPPFFEPSQIVASAAWTDKNTLTMVIRLHETPFYYSLVCRFADDQLRLETKINVSFQEPRTVTFTGHPTA
jgi:CubicO group peptidase (beta-lactamase class C family)